MTDLTPQDWADIAEAIDFAAEEIGWDLHETRNSDFYDAEERAERERRQANWERLQDLILPFWKEDSDAVS